jgi:hypothetical protein
MSVDLRIVTRKRGVRDERIKSTCVFLVNASANVSTGTLETVKEETGPTVRSVISSVDLIRSGAICAGVSVGGARRGNLHYTEI